MCTIIAQYVKSVRRHDHFFKTPGVREAHIWLVEYLAIHAHDPAINEHAIARQCDDPLEVDRWSGAFVPESHDIAASRMTKAVRDGIDEDVFA